MANVTPGYTWASGNTVTAALLNQAVDDATVTNIVNADIDNNAAIALSKLATGALPTAITVASANIVDGTIVDADINASAAIAGSKLADGGITAAKLDGAQTGSAPIYGCRAWVNFNGTSVTNVGGEDRCAIRASGNVSKVVRNAVGTYTITFTTAMPSANYCVFGTGVEDNGTDTGATHQTAVSLSRVSDMTVSSVRILNANLDGNQNVDGAVVTVSVIC